MKNAYIFSWASPLNRNLGRQPSHAQRICIKHLMDSPLLVETDLENYR